MANRVVVFGADSFTGKYLIPELETSGYQVTGTVYSKSKPFVACDITRLDEVVQLLSDIQPSYLINLAGISFVPTNDFRSIYQVNLIGALNICSAIKQLQLQPEKIIMASTGQVYQSKGNEKIDEKSVIQPSSNYGISKWASELAFNAHYSDLPIIISRPFNYTGVGQSERFLIPKIVAHFKQKKEFIELGDMDVYRDFSDVRDVASAYRILMENGEPGATNICSSSIKSISEILNICEELTSHSMEVRVNDDFIRSGVEKYIVGDNSKLKSLGWKPSHPIRETIQWMLD